GRAACRQARPLRPRDRTAPLMDARMTEVILLGSREAGRVTLSARGGERRDANRPVEGNWTTHLGAARRGLGPVRGVAQREARQFHAAANHAAHGPQTGSGDPVSDTRDLTIEPRQLAPADDVDETGPGFAVEGVGPLG